MTIALVILASLLLLATLVMAFMPRKWSAVTAWLSLLCFVVSGFHPGVSFLEDGWAVLLFWGIAVLLVMGIQYLQPGAARVSRLQNAYINGGALVGALVGIIASPTSAGLILGAVVGVLCGGIAFCRTPSGRMLRFPSRPFFRRLLDVGMPAVVVMSIVGMVVIYLLNPVSV